MRTMHNIPVVKVITIWTFKFSTVKISSDVYKENSQRRKIIGAVSIALWCLDTRQFVFMLFLGLGTKVIMGVMRLMVVWNDMEKNVNGEE